MKACVVDDDYTSRVLLGEYLEDKGWKVILFNHPVNSNEIGLTLPATLMEDDIALLVMDVRFGRDKEDLAKGPETVKNLCKEGKLSTSTLVLFVSQFGKEKINFESVEGALNEKEIKFNWLDKPIDFVFLENILKKYIFEVSRNEFQGR